LVLSSVMLASAMAQDGATVRTGTTEHAVNWLKTPDRYDAGVPSIEDFFGHPIGERPLDPDLIAAFSIALEANSDRVSVNTIGQSYEGRPIQLVFITSPENQARLDQIRNIQLRRIASLPTPEDAPIVIWLNFGVHGHEGAALEAAPLLMHHLAADTSDETIRMLEKTVIIIAPNINPDGHARRVAFKRAYSRNVVNRDLIDRGNAMSPRGGGNHYGLNLNRDWLLVTQRETRAMVRAWQAWKPQVTADFHEMSTIGTYYFHPGVKARKNPLIPDRLRELADAIAKVNRGVFEVEGQLTYSEEGFDNMFPGKGSTYPQLNGSVGILFEAGNARSGEVETANGLRTIGDNARLHAIAALGVINASIDLRDDILAAQTDFYAEAQRLSREDETTAYILTSKDLPRMRRFADLLDHHGIQIDALQESVTIDGVTYTPEKSVIVKLRQPQYLMVKTIFDRPTEFSEPRFYDVSGWTLPLSFDLSYTALSETQLRKIGSTERFSLETEAEPDIDIAAFGYMIAWDRLASAGALHDLLTLDLNVRVTTKPVTLRTTAGLQEFPRGSVFLTAGRQPLDRQNLFESLKRISQERRVPVASITDSSSLEAGQDPGGRTFVPLRGVPNVLLLARERLYRGVTGEIFFFFDQQAELPLTLARPEDLRDTDLADYSHIIVADNDFVSESSEWAGDLDRWIRAGGTFIAVGSGAEWAQKNILHQPTEELGTGDNDVLRRFDYDQIGARKALDVIGGAIVASDVDPSHPIAFGQEDRFLPTMRNSTRLLARPDDPMAVVAQYTDDPLLSGYLTKAQSEGLKSAPSVIAILHENGRIILISDNPVFRGVFPGSAQILINSLYFSSILRRGG